MKNYEYNAYNFQKMCMGCVPSTLCKLSLTSMILHFGSLEIVSSLFTSTCSNLYNKLCDQKTTNWVLPYPLTFVLWTTTTHCLWLPHCFWHCRRFEAFVSTHHCMCAFHFNLFYIYFHERSTFHLVLRLEHFFICFIRSTVILVKWPLVCLSSKCIQEK